MTPVIQRLLRPTRSTVCGRSLMEWRIWRIRSPDGIATAYDGTDTVGSRTRGKHCLQLNGWAFDQAGCGHPAGSANPGPLYENPQKERGNSVGSASHGASGANEVEPASRTPYSGHK